MVDRVEVMDAVDVGPALLRPCRSLLSRPVAPRLLLPRLLLVLVLSWSVAAEAAIRPDPSDWSTPGSGPLRVGGTPPAQAPGKAQPNTAGPDAAVTEHTILVQGQPLHYRATAGYLPLEDSAGKPLARIFFVAYERVDDAIADCGFRIADSRHAPSSIHNPESAIRNSGPPSSGSRPLVFAFNGGPGASSLWLHVGALGPKRAVLGRGGTTLPAVERLVDNESTWLTFADLVFVDPVGTGFSRAAPGVAPAQFYAVQKDTEVATDFIRLFTTKYGRWLSPLFLVGESYGTTRAVTVARRLQDRYGLYVRGLVLLSSALNLQLISFDPGNDLPYALALPSYAAVALYHGEAGSEFGWQIADFGLKRESDANPQSAILSPRTLIRGRNPQSYPSALDRILQEAQAWALNGYLAALAQGAQLSPPDFQEVVRALSRYTGLPADMIAQSRLRISNYDFAQVLLGSTGRVVGLLDGRVTAPGVSSARRGTDPSLFIVVGPFTAAFNHYVRSDLGFRTDLPYIYLSTQANESWNWGTRLGYLNVAPILTEAMSLDTRLRVFNAAGYYDLTTPYLGQEYFFHHLDLPGGLRQNITLRRYPAGHQIYTSPESLGQLTADVQAFITASPTP